ncbi:recombinase family protein [Methylobacterium sp. J-077]|uniref:recombinase family protein n=1 Tax=Methylobacterium sp. J-077 TaxID=2836656 RepID=UPI001FB895A5|nr:recombinase family protein [Methylobacterium sp. J-077]MCJ2124342.1 recombinase family protein [Methylobacterium sp. J-077]
MSARAPKPRQIPPPGTRPTLRCAIYTRVSTDHGLDQEFNSLDNQREAAEAYVRSQAHEGWRLLPGRYDDGGFSGGSLERPALQRLLAEVRARRVDVIVVYKVDRLTRALSDFAKLVELFDGHGVSFVSVTQAFNTTTSMGRLTLNVLLSFAQFEREVTGERIRDKIAASKRKGIWMGGVVPLGYRVEGRALHVVEEHAALVRAIFAGYLAHGTVAGLKQDLDGQGITLPARRDGAGRETGGGPFSRGHLYKLLGNPLYVGQLRHKGQVHEGQHPAIVDEATWQAVQDRLATNHHQHHRTRAESVHLLAGRLRDAGGALMVPSHAQKGAVRYRYYVSRTVGINDKRLRLPAASIEAVVVAGLRSIAAPSPAPRDDAALVVAELETVTVHADHLVLQFTGERPTLSLSFTHQPQRRRQAIVVPPGREGDRLRAMKAEDRARMLLGIAAGRTWMRDLVAGRSAGIETIALAEQRSERSVRMTLSLALLSPRIVRAIVEARLPRGIGLRHLCELPPAWDVQERILGL